MMAERSVAILAQARFKEIPFFKESLFVNRPRWRHGRKAAGSEDAGQSKGAGEKASDANEGDADEAEEKGDAKKS